MGDLNICHRYVLEIVLPKYHRCLSSNKSKHPQVVDAFDDGFDYLLNGKCDWFMAGGSLLQEGVNGRFCRKLTVVGKPFFEHGMSYVLPKNSSITDRLSIATLRIVEENRLQTLVAYGATHSCPDITDSTMTWDRLSGFFYVVYAMLGFFAAFTVIDQCFLRSRPEAELPECIDAQNNV